MKELTMLCITSTQRRRARPRQRGVGALAVSMLLLFASSIVVFYLNRGLIFEQKASANQVRSTSAFEAAEAGIEWATGMLNEASSITAACTAGGGGSHFAGIYAPAPGGSIVATTTAFPGCKLNGTALTCACPAPGAGVANLTSGVALPSFTVAFQQVDVIDPVTGAATTDPKSVRLISTGCTAQDAACAPGAVNAADGVATARVEVVLRFSPTLRAAPQAALTCGLNCAVSGSYDIRNVEVSSNGYLVNAGTDITTNPGVTYETIPGQPIENALIAYDTSLSALASTDPTCTNSNLFKAFFGITLAEYAALPNVTSITCSNPSDCATKVQAAYNPPNNARDFYFPSGLDLNSSQFPGPKVLGSNDQQGSVRLVSPGDININGKITINGMLFSNSSNFQDLGTGTADINGSIITCAAYGNNGSGLLNFSSAAAGGTGPANGRMTRVPGSWRDFQ
jgi:hypothetical protein